MACGNVSARWPAVAVVLETSAAHKADVAVIAVSAHEAAASLRSLWHIRPLRRFEAAVAHEAVAVSGALLHS